MRHPTALFIALATASAAAEPPVSGTTPPANPPLARRADDTALQWGVCPDFMPKGCRLGVLHGDPAQPNADVFLQVPGGARVPSHWHSSAERMVLVEGRLRVHYKGHDPAVLEPGMYAYGPPRLSHSAVCESTTPCTLFIAFEGPVDAIAD